MNPESLCMRLLPPILVAVAWRMSRVTLVPEYDGFRDWRVLGRAVAVLWLASVGPDGCTCNIVVWILLVLSLLAGGGVHLMFPPQVPPQTKTIGSFAMNYFGKLLYASMHAGIIASLGLFVFRAMRAAKCHP